MDEKESILIVEDDESTCRSLALIFGKKGYETETAGTGREAIEKAQGRFFNLALLDIRLPDMEGVELVAPLKEMHPDMVVVMVTGYASMETAVRALNEGASGYITKPLNMDEVLAKVREALEKQRLVMENRRLFRETRRELFERKRAEEALRESEERWRSITENSPDHIMTVDLEHNILFINRTIPGVTREEMIGKSIYNFIPEKNQEAAKQCFDRVLKSKQPDKYFTDFTDAKGITHYYEARVAPLLESDKLCGFTISGTDITERKQAQEEIRRRSAYLETLLRINATVRSTLPLDQVLETIAQGTAEAFGHIGSLITLPDGTGERLAFGAAWGGRFLDVAARLTGFELKSFSLSLKARENPIVEAYLTGDLQSVSNTPARIVAGVEPPITPKLASLIERTMGAKLAACVPLPVGETVVGVLTVFCPQDQLPDDERAMLLGLADQAGLAIENAQLYEEIQTELTQRKRAEEGLEHTLEKLRKALGATIQAMALTVEAKDAYTAGHQQRSTNLARTIATKMGLSEEQIDGIRMAGVIHDIGKISVPGEILSKPGRLTDIEFSLIRTHPQVGYDILKPIEFPWPVAQIVLQHHERIDGSGYPAGLTRDEIMLEARILAVADVVEAMCSHRPYRPAHSIDEALEEIRQNRGVLYDAEVVDACLTLFRDEGFKLEHA